jgi:hypothetical protein
MSFDRKRNWPHPDVHYDYGKEHNYERKLDCYSALWQICYRYHSGQWSRGYRILSRLYKMGFKPSLSTQNGMFDTENQRMFYRFFFHRLRHNL